MSVDAGLASREGFLRVFGQGSELGNDPDLLWRKVYLQGKVANTFPGNERA